MADLRRGASHHRDDPAHGAVAAVRTSGRQVLVEVVHGSGCGGPHACRAAARPLLVTVVLGPVLQGMQELGRLFAEGADGVRTGLVAHALRLCRVIVARTATLQPSEPTVTTSSSPCH